MHCLSIIRVWFPTADGLVLGFLLLTGGRYSNAILALIEVLILINLQIRKSMAYGRGMYRQTGLRSNSRVTGKLLLLLCVTAKTVDISYSGFFVRLLLLLL